MYGDKTFSSLKGFAKELKDMSHDAFSHHVTPAKNDFAAWVGNSMDRKDLAKSIDKKIDKIEMELEVLRHIVHEESKPKKKTTTTTKKKPTSKKKTQTKSKK